MESRQCLLTEKDVLVLAHKKAMFPLDWAEAEASKHDDQEPIYIWLSDEEWSKLMFHTRSQVSAILHPLRAYGQEPYVEEAEEEDYVVLEVAGDEEILPHVFFPVPPQLRRVVGVAQ